MTTNWDEHASKWDHDERVRDYADKAFSSLITHVDVRGGAWQHKRLLDFGCGTGLLTEKLSPLLGDVMAVDTSPDMIDVLSNKGLANVTAICADLNDEAVRSDATWFSGFDLIVASSVCGFLPDYPATLRVLAQTLNVTGQFVQWDWRASGDDDSGLTAQKISRAFEQAGLVNDHVGEAFTIPFDDEELTVLMGVASKG